MVARKTEAERRLRRRSRESEPEGLAEAVAAGALTLALMTSLAFVGFAWERNREKSAHALAVELVSRLSTHGRNALLPPWSGLGEGPAAPTAKATFDAVRNLGSFTANHAGFCRQASRFVTCSGSRFACTVQGETPSGPIKVNMGLCRGGSGAPWTFDSLDVTVPAAGGDTGNRSDVETARDGMIRYGSSPPPPDAVPTRLHRRGFALPFLW